MQLTPAKSHAWIRILVLLALTVSSLALPRAAGAAGPSVEITAAPNDPSTDGNPSFSFTSPDPQAVFHCSIDGGANYDCTSPEVIGTPEIVGSLAQGEHTFTVWAEDTLGVWGTEDVHAWSIGEFCYVDILAAGADDGSSWTDAYVDLQDALTDTACKEIWVANGTYLPDGASVGDRALTFTLVDGVEVYGGFAGGEVALDARDWAANLTTLSGAITGNNTYHVVTGSGVGPGAVLDGFTIRDGFATGTGNDDSGAGMFIYDGAPTLAHLTVYDNYAAVQGGGMNIQSATPAPVITDSTFDLNEAGVFGGGIYAAFSSVTLTNVTFKNNDANADGGALVSTFNAPTLTNVTFHGNTASDDGGAIFNSGSGMTLINVTFSGNTATSQGGAMYSEQSSAVTVHDSIFWPAADGIHVDNATSATTTIVDSVVDGACPANATCTNVIDADPLLEPLQDNGGPTQTMALLTGSAATDAGGVNTTCADTDQRGVPRPQGAGCDIGAYERNICYVDDTAAGADNGSSWTDAYTDLQGALGSVLCDDAWVAEGVYKPDAADPLNRTLSFGIPPGAAVYGGFAGTETLLSQRNWEANLTILSGDIDSDDLDGDNDDIADSWTDVQNNNSYHVVFFDGVTNDINPTTVLDGFTITAGRPNAGGKDGSGGGIFCDAEGAGAACSPSLRNLAVIGNRGNFGGGLALNVFVDGISSAVIEDTTFTANRADGGNGGAVAAGAFSAASVTSPIFRNVTFEANSANGRGGAVMVGASSGTLTPTFANVTFNGNTANSGGALSAWSYGSTGAVDVDLINTTFSLNSATKGGAIATDVETTGSALVTITNTILWDDTVSGVGSAGPEIYNEGNGSTSISYSVVEGSLPGAVWDASLGTDGGNNIDANPNLDALADNGGFTRTMALLPGSSAIEAGDDVACAAAPVEGLDQRYMARPQGPHCDIGAFEAEFAAAPVADFDGDGDTDVSVFRDGVWYVQNQGVTGWGQVADIPIAADFDADGDSDYAVYRPSTGGWRVKDQFTLAYGGVAGDVPVPGDYDGDDDADVAIYRTSTAGWYIKDQFTVGYGLSTDIPVPGDYNGDGITDIAVFRDGVWFIKDQGVIGWGQLGDIPIPGDYNGDGVTDLAVYRPSTGGWRVKDQFTVAHGGLVGDLPVPGDYNADGVTDVAIYRSSTAGWYVKDQFTVGYGLSTDYPVPARDTNGDGDPYQ